MKYYLVALFDDQSYQNIEKIQKDVCRKQKIYKNLPTLHITLEVIGDPEPDMEKLSGLISDAIKNYKKFKVESTGIICFEPPYKSANLKIENKGYIIRLARIINETLKEHGFNVRQSISNWDLHVSLANNNFASREWSAREYGEALEKAKKENFHMMATINRLELWKSTNNKKEMVVKSYPLKSFL